MKKWFYVFILIVVMPVQAAIDVYQFENSSQEALYKQMVNELRCLVCQNQNISSSNAALAQDLRQQTYEMIISGKSRAEIMAYMTQRYGDFVLYRPPVKLITIALWMGPILLLLIGVGVLISALKKRRNATEQSLNDEQHSHIKYLLEKGEK